LAGKVSVWRLPRRKAPRKFGQREFRLMKKLLSVGDATLREKHRAKNKYKQP